MLLCGGCGRQNPTLQESSFDVLFVLNGGGAEKTRSTAVADETHLNEWCLYIVDNNGDVCDAVSTNSPSTIRNYRAGTYTAYAVVNCGTGEGTFNTEAEIKAASRSLIAETTAFGMFGSSSFSVPDDAVCPIPILRLVSKIEIRKIITDFSPFPDLAAQSFTLDRIYLINVAGESRLSDNGTFAPEIWYNKRGYVQSGADPLLYDAVGVTISQDNAYSVSHCFYCYQNNALQDSHSPAWCSRHTRLVLECSIGARKTYYPIDIIGPDGILGRNSHYLINELVITDTGTDSPDEPISGSLPYHFSSLVKSWDGTYTINEEF